MEAPQDNRIWYIFNYAPGFVYIFIYLYTHKNIWRTVNVGAEALVYFISIESVCVCGGYLWIAFGLSDCLADVCTPIVRPPIH